MEHCLSLGLLRSYKLYVLLVSVYIVIEFSNQKTRYLSRVKKCDFVTGDRVNIHDLQSQTKKIKIILLVRKAKGQIYPKSSLVNSC